MFKQPANLRKNSWNFRGKDLLKQHPKNVSRLSSIMNGGGSQLQMTYPSSRRDNS